MICVHLPSTYREDVETVFTPNPVLTYDKRKVKAAKGHVCSRIIEGSGCRIGGMEP